MSSPRPPRKPRVGLVLGGGAARGWAHIGVIQALTAAGVRPDLVCGTSIGALVGAAYAAGHLDRFEAWVRALSFTDVLSFMDVGIGAGLLKGERLMNFIRGAFSDRPIEDLPVPFGAVATALHSGAEVWLRSGSTLDAVRASIAMPGLFTPVVREEVLLVDGGLVNPVPVSLARAMGAEVVIAVDLSTDILGRHLVTETATVQPATTSPEWLRKLHDELSELWPGSTSPATPSLIDVIASSLSIMQVRISRSRMAGDPPEIVIAPRLASLRLLDFHRAADAIDAGRSAISAAMPALQLVGVVEARDQSA